MSVSTANKSTPPSQGSPTRVRANRERAQEAALAELANAQAAVRAKSERLRQLRIENENASPAVAKFMAARRSNRSAK